ncbi:MAG: glycosyltransferase [Planctomycetaceae bacterium]|nr:glycosyltransferase [Planctomycetaceae bacterium]
MITATLFPPRIAATIRRRGRDWLLREREHVLQMARDCGLDQQTVCDAIRQDLGGGTNTTASPVQPQSGTVDVTIVVTCHNYARFLGECLKSIRQSAVQPKRVMVIDDASDDGPQTVAEQFGVEFHRVDFNSVHRARAFGLDLVDTRFAIFLDADNRLDPDFLGDCLARLRDDRRAAFVFPVLQAFDGGFGPWHHTDEAPETVTASDIAARNWCDAGAVFRVDVLRQSGAMSRPFKRPAEDWAMWRAVLSSGPWIARKSAVPLHYRIHTQQASNHNAAYFQAANLQAETVTVAVPFSGRDTWQRVANWIRLQTWPRDQLRLLIVNTSHQDVTLSKLGLGDLRCQSIQLDRLDVGFPGLAEVDRRGRADIQKQVECAVASIWNHVATTARTEYLMCLEDDTIPQRPDTIEALLQHMGPRVAGVTGLYRHRYWEGKSTAIAEVSSGSTKLASMDGPSTQQICGAGFGCLLIRRSVLLQHPLSGDNPTAPHYDVDLGYASTARGWQWLLSRDVAADHLTEPATSTDMNI